MFDLNKLPAHYLAQYGRDKIAEVLDQKPAVVAMWEKSGKMPLDAVQRLLEFDPGPLAEVRPLYEKQVFGKKLAILMPCNSAPEPEAVDCLMRLYDPKEMFFRRVGFNSLSVARNSLCAQWLATDAPWAIWMDADSVAPCGDAPWFKTTCGLPNLSDTYAGINSIYRLLVHQKKFISSVYVARKKKGTPQFGGGHTQEMMAAVRRGPRDEVREVPWVGFGFVLTHRSVFEDIIAQQGDELRMKPGGIGARFGYEYSFFTPTDRETPGDDLPLAARAIRAGHKIHIDMAVHVGHVGSKAYTFEDI